MKLDDTCLMSIVSSLPEFLWELAVAHVTYIQDRLHRTMLANGVQYQHRLSKKPDAAYLRERGASEQSLCVTTLQGRLVTSLLEAL